MARLLYSRLHCLALHAKCQSELSGFVVIVVGANTSRLSGTDSFVHPIAFAFAALRDDDTERLLMTIDLETETQILRYHFVEHWGVNTIAAHLHVHHSTVDRVISRAGAPKNARALRASKIDPYLPFIVATLEKFPRLTAARIHGMLCERGYDGGTSHLRARIAQLRPSRAAEAYLRLRTLPAEQMQCDWGFFSTLTIGRARRPLMAFVMVLSYSRMLFVRFYLNARMESFLDGHVGAIESFGGSARICLYDNLKSAVLERRGDAIRFNPTLLEMAAHYRFEPRPVAPARGNEKGRVERAIRTLRERFFAAREYSSLDDLNEQARDWCQGYGAQRPWPEDPTRKVGEVWAEEQARLIALPNTPFPAEAREEVRVGKTPYVRFDLNDYSVPHTHVRRLVTVAATVDTVRVVYGTDVVAQHHRAWGKGERIEQASHIADLIARKREARLHRIQDRLALAAPASMQLLDAAAAAGRPITAQVRELERMLDEYGAAALQAACLEALKGGVAHTNAVRQSLQRQREQRDLPPPLPIVLPNDARVRNIVVPPTNLDTYDRLSDTDEPEEDTP